ncbi:hypothetical protein GS443_11585 [Rhodococcus hoagii]|nr:hypothetical protein [Prescottella equi]
MTATWRKQEPEVIPLTLWAGEDFVRELVFDGLVGGIPADSTITLKLFDGTDRTRPRLDRGPPPSSART